MDNVSYIYKIRPCVRSLYREEKRETECIKFICTASNKSSHYRSLCYKNEVNGEERKEEVKNRFFIKSNRIPFAVILFYFIRFTRLCYINLSL